jgi:predicted amidohydrolase
MPFLDELAALLKRHASGIDDADRDFGSIKLAAHLFAAASYLRERYGNAQMDTDRPVLATDLNEAIELASNLSKEDPTTAYMQARGALVGLDQHYEDSRLVTRTVLPAFTNLEQVNEENRFALFGRVHHWIRPRSGWRDARAHREELLPAVNVYPPRPADDLNAVGMLWDRGEVPETVPVLSRDLVVPSQQFRIALCPLFCGAYPRFAVTDDGSRFTIDARKEYTDDKALLSYLDRLGPLLETADVQLLVLPELSVTQSARTALAAMLRASRCMTGIVAGSFHFWRNGEEAAPVNECAFLIPDGVAWAHQKLGYFRVTDRQIAQFSAVFRQPLPTLQTRVVEGIQRGSELRFWDTTMGRIAVLICADAIARENMMPAVEKCSPDLLLIPSLSLETDDFVRLAESLSRRGVSVVYLNASTACDHVPNAVAAFVQLALPTPPTAPASRIFWTRNSAPVAYRFHKRAWIEEPADGAELLGNEEALIFDLNQHLTWRKIPAA